MRNYLLLVLVSVVLFSCDSSDQPKDDSNFFVNGKIENAQGKSIMLESVGVGKPVVVDSVVISDDGSFKLSGKTDIPNIYVLRIDNNTFNYLLLDKDEKAEVSAELESFGNTIQVQGSPGSEKLADLNFRLALLQSSIDSLSEIRNEILNDPSKKEELNQLAATANSLVSAHKDYLFNFVEKNPTSIACIAALYQSIGRQKIITPQTNMATFNFVDSSLMANYPNSIHVKNFHANVAKMKSEEREQAMAKNAVDVGSMAPDITLPSPSGKEYSLSSLKGNYVLLDFWAAWCRPCRHESPTLVANYNKYHEKGFEIFQVSLDKTKKDWESAIIADKLAWPYHVSELKHWQSAAAKMYSVNSIPSNFLIDPQGMIIAKNLRGPALSAKLAEIYN